MGHRARAIVATLPLLLLAMPASAAKPVKMGYVDLQRALKEVDEGKAALSRLKKDFEKKQTQLNQRKEELTRLKEALDGMPVTVKEEVQAAKAQEFQQRFLEWQNLGMKLQQQIDEAQHEATKEILSKMQAILAQVGEAEGFTAILLKESLAYAPGHLDLTNELIRRYNEKYPK